MTKRRRSARPALRASFVNAICADVVPGLGYASGTSAADQNGAMRLVHTVPEDDVVAAWVRAETTSERFSAAIKAARDGGARTSAEVLARARGWPDTGYFEGFPRDISWWKALLTVDELLAVLYIDWDYWLDISDGTRLPIRAIAKAGWERGRGLLPDEVEPIIVVQDTRYERLVVLEGHARLTNFVLARDRLPSEVPCLLGQSPTMAKWDCY